MARTVDRRRPGWAAGVALVVLLVAVGLVAGRLASRPTGAGGAVTPAGSPSASAASPVPPPGSDITGPLTMLLVGVDTRVGHPGWQPHADAVLLAHVPAGLDRGYVFSLPRDLLVDVPAFAPAGFRGGRMKLTEAMTRGARVPGTDRPDPRQGFALLKRTVADHTGIDDITVGAVLTFAGFSRLTDALGGVTMRIDQKVVSQHRRPDGTHRTLRPGGGGYVGPQMTYLPGTRRLVGWQALDYARQRYTTGGDYARQRHQRQLVRALLAEAARADLVSDPRKLEGVLRALGETLVFDAGGHTAVDVAYALRRLRPDALTLIGLPGASVGGGGGYRGEQLLPPGRAFLDAVAAGRVEQHLRQHPELIDRG